MAGASRADVSRVTDRWRPGAAPGRATDHELGFSLIEVLIALSVLMVVLLPAADLLIGTGSVISGSEFRGTAQELASSDIAQLQAIASSPGGSVVTPPFTTVNMGANFPLPINVPAGTSAPSWPVIASPPTSTVQNEDYAQYIVGDWCGIASATASSWAPSNSGGPVVFVVAVKVVWGPSPSTAAPTGSSVVAYGALPDESGWSNVPTATSGAGGSTSLCPTGLS